MDITHTEIIEVLAGRTGYGNASTSEYRTKAIRALNNALRRLYQNKFQFQRRSLMFNLVANQINYTNTDTSIIAPDSVKVTTRANRIQSATTWMLDTAGDFTGSVDSALGDDVGDGSVMQIGDNMYEVESYSGDGTTADDIELNYAAASGSIYFVTDSDEGDRGTRTLLPGSYDQIYQYPAKNDRNCPRYFHVESYASTGSTYGQKIYIGDPTPDDTYLVEMWGYFEPTEVTTSNLTDIDILVHLYHPDPIIEWAMYYFYIEIKEHQLAQVQMPIAMEAEARLKRSLPRRLKGDFAA